MHKSQGFTLLELIVVIAIIGIAAAMSIGLSGLVKNSRLTTQINTLVTSINFARSEAIKRGDTVTVCSSTDAVSCAGSVNWSTGWIVFSDPDANGIVAAASDVLRAFPMLLDNNTLTAPRVNLRYRASGRTTNLATGTFALRTTVGTLKGKDLVIGPSGRARINNTPTL